MGARILFFLFIFVLQASYATENPDILEPEASPEESEEASQILDDWAATNLSYKILKSELTIKECYKRLENFLGCIAAINVSFTLADSNSRIGTVDALKSFSSYLGTNEIEFKNLVVGQFSAVENLDEKFDADKAEQKNFTAKMKDTYENSEDRANFTEIFEWLQKNTLKNILEKKEKLVVGYLLNAFYALSIDPHSRLIPKAEFDRLHNSRKNGESFVGIGISFRKINDAIVIAEIMDDGPAQVAGLRVNDQIVSIDGFRISKLNALQCNKRLRGEQGTDVKLRIRRESETFIISVKRDLVKIENVNVSVLPKDQPEFIYARLRSFANNSCTLMSHELIKANEEIKKYNRSPKGIVLDLRSNPGGSLGAATCLVSLFVKPGAEIITERSLEGKVLSTYRADSLSNSEILKLPLTILINAGSASASEVVAGSLQYHGAWVLGDRSFGKASIQSPAFWFQFFHSSWGVIKMVTKRRYFFPSGITPQNQGITPDIFVLPTPETKPEEIISYREENLYENALPSIGEKWSQTRPDEVAALQKCIDETGSASQIWKVLKDSQIHADYQLLYAEDALRCL